MDFLARLALLLSGAWSALGSRIGGIHWDFAPSGRTLALLGIPVAFVAVIVCYYRTTEGLTLRSRMSLATLRFIAFASLLVMAAGVVLSFSIFKPQLPEILLLIDDSQSMQMPQSENGKSRLALAKEALTQGLLKELQQKYTVNRVRTSGLEADDAWLHSSGDGEGAPQNLAKAIVKQAARFSDRRLTDILLISDGLLPANASDLKRVAAEVPAPISCMTFGDGAAVRDVILEDVAVPPYVFQNDRALISAQVRSLGIGGEASVQLVLVQNGAEKPVASSKITLKTGADPATARIEFLAPSPGIQRYILRILPLAGELTEKNNSISFNLDVRPEKIRMLFVEGEPSWEYRYAKQVLESDPAVEFYGLVRLGDQEWFFQGNPTRPDGKPVLRDPKKGFPESADELNFFDVLVIGDLERKIFEQGGRFGLVDAFVRQHGGGMATLGGFKVYGAGNYEGTDLARMLPVEIVHEKKQQLINRFNVQVTSQGLMHPLMQMEFDPEKNEKAWAELPWIEGGNAFATIKTGATLLMVHPTLTTRFGPRPVSAAWQYGRGRTYSTALDGTWHWRLARKTETDYHQRYWGLLARWLAGDPRSAKACSSIVCDDAVLEVGRPATFSVQVRDAEGNPMLDAAADFSITLPNSEILLARSSSDPAVPGRYAVTFVPTQSGDHKVKVEIATHADQRQKQELSWYVSDSRQEYLRVRPDEKALDALARARGGISAPIAKFNVLKMPARETSVVTQAVVINLWQSQGLLVLLVTCLSIEWLLRKRRGLA